MALLVCLCLFRFCDPSKMLYNGIIFVQTFRTKLTANKYVTIGFICNEMFIMKVMTLGAINLLLLKINKLKYSKTKISDYPNVNYSWLKRSFSKNSISVLISSFCSKRNRDLSSQSFSISLLMVLT